MIENKVVVITGASSGIGAATATLLAERGAKVVLGARRKDRLDALAGRLGAISLPTDVRRPEDVAALVRLARETHGRLDVLVGNAGVGPISPLDSLRVDDWDTMIDVNVKGVLHGIAAALPVFRAQGFGQFVHTASTAAYRTVPTMAVYAATKTAVRTISEGLRQEAGPDLRVSLVSPGLIATDFIDGIPEAEVRDRLVESRDAVAIPPEAIAGAIAFAIDQPAEVDVNEIVVRPTAQD
ncbi:SDR family oxidoreductase [Amycolatopsis rifamycinica]|uniref:Oxidoreductase n=1 Tax=Amycolatopsis rifamycinica TaxID=287986 RepID=A0A066UC46_9PSEU|nr:SDR family oxidoreductase [Amycolatopsis rifamycinica]KDN23462.1 oxidoreductase [Amycolatopsis rifamycinica]